MQDWREAHPRFHFHFIPTYASWLNRVETWFSALQRHVLAHGSWDSVQALQAAVGRYVRGRNRHALPPRWQGEADAILAQLAQIRRTYETVP